ELRFRDGRGPRLQREPLGQGVRPALHRLAARAPGLERASGARRGAEGRRRACPGAARGRHRSAPLVVGGAPRPLAPGPGGGAPGAPAQGMRRLPPELETELRRVLRRFRALRFWRWSSVLCVAFCAALASLALLAHYGRLKSAPVALLAVLGLL